MAEVERILGKKTKGGRVHYLIRWLGQSEQNDTWESRIDLKQDGHFAHVKAYEAERKANNLPDEDEQPKVEADGKAEPKVRGRSRGKSPKRSRSVSKKDGTSPRPRSKSRGASVHRERKKRTPKADEQAATPTPEAVVEQVSVIEQAPATAVKQATQASQAPTPEPAAEASIFGDHVVHERSLPSRPVDSDVANDADDENDVFNKQTAQHQLDAMSSAEYDHLAKLVDALRQQGWLYRFAAFLVVVLAMIANALVPQVEENFASETSEVVLAVLTKTNAVPPLICLALVLCGNFNRVISKWISICLVWRTAVEIVLQLPDHMTTYAYVIYMCMVLADLSSLAAVGSAVLEGGRRDDIVTPTLCAAGWALIVASDCIFFWDLLASPTARFLIMSFGAIALSLSSGLSEAE